MRALIVLLLAPLFAATFGAPASAQRESEFMQKFREAMTTNAIDEMASLVTQYEQEAILAVIETCDEISAGSSDQLEDEIDGLGKAWRQAYDSQFVMNQYEYISLLTPVYRKTRAELVERYHFKFGEFDEARKAKDEGKLSAIGMDFSGMAEGFEEVGDDYMASVCYLHYGQCFDEELAGDEADFKRACSAYGKSLETRQKVALEDALYRATKARFDELEYSGYGDPTKGPEARLAERMEGDPSFRPTPIGATFEAIEDVTATSRPFYGADPAYQTWMTVYLGKKGSTGKFPTMEESPEVVRDGAASASVDVDGDGEGDVKIPLGGNVELVRIPLGHGDAQREWAFLATVGQMQDTLQGVQPFNLAPADEVLQIYFAPAGSIVGAIAETRIQIFDDNLDGIYGSLPKWWAHLGLREGDSQPDFDSMLIGKAKTAVPWSDLVQIGEDWYRLTVDEDSADVIASKQADVETGTLKLDFKGPKPDYLIVQGAGRLENTYFDLAPTGKKGLEVPAGVYQLVTGRISKGSRDQMAKALIVRTKNTPTWRVSADGTATVELGAPFGFDFEISGDREAVTVKGSSIVITGRGNETYQRFWNCVPRPEVYVRKAGSKKGSKSAKMRTFESQDQINAQGNWDGVWAPYDATAEKKNAGEDSEVQLIEKKNKLFGKVESDWKGE